LKAGTLEKIIEYITDDQGELDTCHMHILFSTYRTFTNVRLLIETLVARYRIVLPASLDMTEDVRQNTLKYAHEIFTDVRVSSMKCKLSMQLSVMQI
jgi:hypothetical protein